MIVADDDLEPPMTVQPRGGAHRPSLVDTVPRFALNSELKQHEPSSGRVEDDALNVSPSTQQDVLLDFQKKFPPSSRVDVTWDDPVMNFSGRIVGKGRLDTSGKAIFQVLYDEGGEKFWHEVDSTPVSLLAAKLKTLVVGGERVTELTEVPDLVTGDVTVACLITQLQKHRAELVVAFLTAMDGIDKHDADALREAVASEDCEAGAHNILFPLMDVDTGEIIQLISAVVSNGKERSGPHGGVILAV